jgi:hypothetical protein
MTGRVHRNYYISIHTTPDTLHSCKNGLMDGNRTRTYDPPRDRAKDARVSARIYTILMTRKSQKRFLNSLGG